MTEDLEYFKSEEFRLILKKYEDSAKSGHRIYMDADDLADIADYYQFNDRTADAEEAIALALEYNPNAVGPLLYQARKAVMEEDFETAREYAMQIAAVDRLESVYLQGEIMINEGNAVGADLYFREEMKNIMNDELSDYVIDIARIFSDYDLYDYALQWLMRSKDKHSDEFKEVLGYALFGTGRYQESGRIFNELIDHNPYSPRYWNSLANLQIMQEQYGAAITSIEYAIAIDPDDPDNILTKANCFYYMSDFESALTYFRRYSELTKDNEFGYLYQAICMVNLGKNKEAVELLEGILPNIPPDSQYMQEIYQELAFAYSALHKLETALYYLDQTIDLDCDHVNIEIIRGHILLADKRLKEAREAFKNALHMTKDTNNTYFRIIVSYYDNYYISTAYHMLTDLLQKVPEDWKDGYSYMAFCNMQLGRVEDFFKYMKMAAEKNPKEAKQILGHLFPEGIEPENYYAYYLNHLKSDI